MHANDSIIRGYVWRKFIALSVNKYRKFKNPKISLIFVKILALSIVWSKCKNEDGKIFKEEESIEILKTIGLIKNI